jgi:hypothetical protein
MGEKWNAYRIMVGKPEWKRPLVRPTCRWEHIRIDVRKTDCGGYGLVSSGSGLKLVVSSCGHGNKILYSSVILCKLCSLFGSVNTIYV